MEPCQLKKALHISLMTFASSILLTSFINCSKFEGSSDSSQTGLTQDQINQLENPDKAALAQRFFPGMEAGYTQSRIWRLTPEQIENTLSDVATVTPGQITSHMEADTKMYGYDNFAGPLLFYGSNYDLYGEAVKPVVTAMAAAISTACPAPPTSSSVTTCAIGKIRKLAAFLFRDEESSAPVDELIAFSADDIALTSSESVTVSNVVRAALFSPYFLYRVEVPLAAGPMSARQVADSLAYTLTNSPADATLLAAAKTSDPGGASFLVGQATRLLNTVEGRKNLSQFVMEWLELATADELDENPQVQSYGITGLGAALLGETKKFLDFNLTSPTAALPDLLTANYSFVNNKNNAIYKMSKAFNNKFERTDLDPNQRLGILTQPSFLASHVGGGDFNIISRGKIYLSKVLCLSTPAVPRNVNIKLDEALVGSARQRLSKHAESPVCASCHNMLDPLGFANENYSKSGEWQTMDSGQTIDPSADLSFIEPGKNVANSIEMVRYVASSEQVKQCFVRQMFRYVYGRMETPTDDPFLRNTYFNFSQSPGDIRGLVMKLISGPEFVVRN